MKSIGKSRFTLYSGVCGNAKSKETGVPAQISTEMLSYYKQVCLTTFVLDCPTLIRETRIRLLGSLDRQLIIVLHD